jgi:hypothetical protein
LAFAAVALPASLFAAVGEPVQMTVLVDFEQPHSRHTLRQVQTQLDRVLSGTGLTLSLAERNGLETPSRFHDLLLFTMKGQCSMEALPIGALSDERGALAMVHSTDGEILHYGEVECDKIRSSLEHVLGKQQTRAYQGAFDIALGNVMAHEIYHMLAGSAEHTHSGVTRPGLSASELLNRKLALPEAARLAIRRKLAENALAAPPSL